MLQRSEAPDYAYNAMRPITVTAAITLFMIGVFGVVGIFYDQYRDRIPKKSRC